MVWNKPGALVVVGSVGAVAAGDYVYREGTTVPCAINDDDLLNTPEFLKPRRRTVPR